MPPQPYAGHKAGSSSAERAGFRKNADGTVTAIADADSSIAAADRENFDPADAAWANFPGGAARAGGHPRADGDGGKFRSR